MHQNRARPKTKTSHEKQSSTSHESNDSTTQTALEKLELIRQVMLDFRVTHNRVSFQLDLPAEECNSPPAKEAVVTEISLAGKVTQEIHNLLKPNFGDLKARDVGCGLAGGGGIVINRGPNLVITAMQYFDKGLKIRVDQDGWYFIVEIETDQHKEIEQYLRKSSDIICSAPPTKWPPTELQKKLHRLQQKVFTVWIWTGVFFPGPVNLYYHVKGKIMKKKA